MKWSNKCLEWEREREREWGGGGDVNTFVMRQRNKWQPIGFKLLRFIVSTSAAFNEFRLLATPNNLQHHLAGRNKKERNEEGEKETKKRRIPFTCICLGNSSLAAGTTSLFLVLLLSQPASASARDSRKNLGKNRVYQKFPEMNRRIQNPRSRSLEIISAMKKQTQHKDTSKETKLLSSGNSSNKSKMMNETNK